MRVKTKDQSIPPPTSENRRGPTLSSGVLVELALPPGLVEVEFEEQESATAFFDFLCQIVPLQNEKYPRINNCSVLLTEDQHYFYQLIEMQKTGTVTQSFLGDKYLLKTLRADEFAFDHAFIMGIIPGATGLRRQNLRPHQRQDYTVKPSGKLTSRFNKTPMYTAEEKEGFSQNQSTTFIDHETQSRAFGVFRRDKLYGLMTHLSDALINRMLPEDSGTVAHVFDYHDRQQAFSSPWVKKDTKDSLVYHPNEIDRFKAHNLKIRPESQKTNEVIARLRFNPHRSIVCICTNTLEARLLASHFAQELMKEFKHYANRTDLTLNPNFKIPIIFYLPIQLSNECATPDNNSENFPRYQHDLRFYTPEMRLADEAEATEIYSRTALRNDKYSNNNFEFLLGLKEITPEILLEKLWQGIPLALFMMRNHYVKILLRLTGTTYDSNNPNLCYRVFKSLIDSSMIETNDQVIAELIWVEAFDLADTLISATQSNKFDLLFRNKSLTRALLVRGNPRQVHYMQCDSLLILAAKAKAWVTIILFVKEHHFIIDKYILGILLCHACEQHQYREADFLLTMGANTSVAQCEGDLKPIERATDLQDWAMITLFCAYITDKIDLPCYGYALLGALKHQEMGLAKMLLTAGAKSNWRYLRKDDPRIASLSLTSPLGYAIENDCTDTAVLSSLLYHETPTLNDGCYASRIFLALELAYIKENASAIALLEKFIEGTSLVDENNLDSSLFLLFLMSLSAFPKGLAEMRLLQRLHSYHLLDEKDYNILSWLKNIMDIDRFSVAISLMPKHSRGDIVHKLTELYLRHQEITSINAMLARDFYPDGVTRRGVTIAIYGAIVESISPENKGLIGRIYKPGEMYKYWEAALDIGLERALENNETDKALVLMGLGASGEVCLTHLLKKGEEFLQDSEGNDERLTLFLVEHLGFKQDDIDALIKAVIKSGKGEEILKKSKFHVSSEHLDLVAMKRSVPMTLQLLLKLDKNDCKKVTYFIALQSVWELALLDQHLLKETIRILDPSLIRHLVLSTLLAEFLSTLSMTNAQHCPPCLSTVVSILTDYSDHFAQSYGHLNLFYTKVGTVSTSSRFFSQFNNNFELIDGHLTLHLDETLIANTFERVLSQLEAIPQRSKVMFGFFEATREYFVERLINIIKATHQFQNLSILANITQPNDERFAVHTQPPVLKCL